MYVTPRRTPTRWREAKRSDAQRECIAQTLCFSCGFSRPRKGAERQEPTPEFNICAVLLVLYLFIPLPSHQAVSVALVAMSVLVLGVFIYMSSRETRGQHAQSSTTNHNCFLYWYTYFNCYSCCKQLLEPCRAVGVELKSKSIGIGMIIHYLERNCTRTRIHVHTSQESYGVACAARVTSQGFFAACFTIFQVSFAAFFKLNTTPHNPKLNTGRASTSRSTGLQASTSRSTKPQARGSTARKARGSPTIVCRSPRFCHHKSR
jgi:hypothetical protein